MDSVLCSKCGEGKPFARPLCELRNAAGLGPGTRPDEPLAMTCRCRSAGRRARALDLEAPRVEPGSAAPRRSCTPRERGERALLGRGGRERDGFRTPYFFRLFFVLIRISLCGVWFAESY